MPPRKHKKNADSLASIESIKEKRLLLKRVVMITRATERMQDSLRSVLVLGQPSTGIPDGVLKYYHVLSNKIKAKPTEKISWYLSKLEGLIQTGLHEIISIATHDHADDGYSDESMNLLAEFRRQSQTAVALKILLQQRGVYTSGTEVKIPVQQIKEYIRKLEKKEQLQRIKLQAHIAEMHADLSMMLNSDQYSDDMKAIFRSVMANLENDQKAINEGARIDQWQFSFEVIETGEDKRSNPVAVQQQVVTETEECLEDIEQRENVVPEADKKGFFRILLKWLNTPWNVSWSDIRRNRK